MEPIDVNDVRVQTLVGLGTEATPEQIARLLDKHNGHMDNVAAALLDGSFEVDDMELRGRQLTHQLGKPALPPRRKQNSPVDNSRALVRVENANNPAGPPTYDEDIELKKAMELSLAEAGGGGGTVDVDDGPPPLEPIQDQLPFYGPLKPGLDQSTDHALRQALEASLNDGKHHLATDVYEELPIDQQVRASDGRPTVFRSSSPTSIFAPAILQSLLSVPELLTRLKEIRKRLAPSQDIEIEQILDGPWNDCEIIRELFTHAETTHRSYVDIKEWAENAGWARDDVAGSFGAAAIELLQRLTRALNLSLPNNEKPLFLPTLHDPHSPNPPPSHPVHPHEEVYQYHQDHLLYLIPLRTSPTQNSLVEVLESQVSGDRTGFNLLPCAMVFKVDREGGGGGGKFEFPARLWMDRWCVSKREFVEGVVLRRAREVEILLKGMEEERLKLVRHEGRDTLADLRVCIKHFENVADPKRAERNLRTLGKLKVVLKDFEDRCAELAKKSEALKEEQLNLWNRPELMNIPYDLRAVIIHDGLLGRTHLYSYIKRNNKWWKIVDANVTEVTEETVLGDSVGVHLGAGVMNLIYAAPDEQEGQGRGKWGSKERLKSHKLDKPWLEHLSPETQARLQPHYEPISSDEEEEEEYMDADEMIVVDDVHEMVEVDVDVPEDVSMEEVNPPVGVV